MFQLITAVVAIVLIAVMILAAVWIGGDVWSESTQRAMYSEHVNAAAQIDGALQLYFQEKGFFPAEENEALLNLLVSGKYLNNAPQGGWQVSAQQLYKPVTDLRQCEVLNKVAGKDISTEERKCPSCDNEAYKDYPGCMLTATTP
jgi:type II secretory pathway pseudopilin PulG